jgi:hypothetical protein
VLLLASSVDSVFISTIRYKIVRNVFADVWSRRVYCSGELQIFRDVYQDLFPISHLNLWNCPGLLPQTKGSVLVSLCNVCHFEILNKLADLLRLVSLQGHLKAIIISKFL